MQYSMPGTLATVMLVLFLSGAATSMAAEPDITSDPQALQQAIEAQQRQLDAQQQDLDAQNKKLQQLRRQVKGLSKKVVTTKVPVADNSEALPSISAPPRRVDTHTKTRDKTQQHEEWKGSFGVEGINTRFKVGGFAELDVIHDSDAILSKGQFVTSTIVTRNTTKAQGSDGQTNFSVSPSRLYFESRTPTKQNHLTTFLSFDLYGDALGVQPEPRLRQAYAEISNILYGGDLLIGQAWSTAADLEAFPNVLDFQGPNSFFGATRQPMVRWSKGIADHLKLSVAAETPNNHIIQGADSLTAWPDGVASIFWHRSAAELMGTVVARDLRASLNDGPTDNAFGWGGSVTGKVGIPTAENKDFFTFSLSYGEGVGSYFNDQPPDAVFDSSGTNLMVIPVLGWFISYEHWWNNQFSSTFVYSILDVDNLNSQPSDSLDKTNYTSANVVWTPIEHWLFGIEALWGKREDKDGREGTDFRTQFTSRVSF